LASSSAAAICAATTERQTRSWRVVRRIHDPLPAIDLKDGQCVRLQRGEMDRATLYNADPAGQAVRFRDLGFGWLHVVDLDGAFAGESRNGSAIDGILEAVSDSVHVQVGGGIRTRHQIEAWMLKNVARVILGTTAARNPELVREAAREHPGRIAVGIDARGGKAAVEGWAETSDMEALDLARAFEDAGVAAVIYTDIDRDGVLAGINWEATIALAEAVSIPVIASGGLASMADIERLTRPDAAKLEGAISGRALYDGRLTPRPRWHCFDRRGRLGYNPRHERPLDRTDRP
jgi:phosphoribosylformimino-5-aminoimidazole carboxamide ribotide isomerase